MVSAGPTPRIEMDDGATIPARLAGELPGAGQRCAVMFQRGTPIVMGAFGQPRLLALAEPVTSDQTGISAETALTGLTVEAVIPGPNRLIGIMGHVQVRVSTAGSVIGRVRCGALGTTADPEVTWPRYGRGRCESAGAGNGLLLGGMAIHRNPDPGPILYTATLQGPSTTAAENAIEPAGLFVFDLGAIPGGEA